MALGGGPIQGEAQRRGLMADDIAAAGRQEGREEQARLDEEELRELDRALYDGVPAPGPAAAEAPPAGLVDQIRARLHIGR